MYDHYSVMSVKRFGRKVPWKRMLYHLKLSSDLQTLVKIWAKSHNSSTSVFGTRYLSAISSQSSQLCFSWPTWCKGKAAAQLELPPPDVGLYNNQNQPWDNIVSHRGANEWPLGAPPTLLRWSHFREVVRIFELRRVGGAPKGHLFAPLVSQHKESMMPNMHERQQGVLTIQQRL